MPYTAVTKPSQGDPTLKSFADALIDNQAYFNSQLSTIASVAIPNASFEIDSDADGYPDEWTFTSYNDGTLTITGNGKADTAVSHGSYALKITAPGVSGGGYLETDNFIEVTPNRVFTMSWQHYASVTNIRDKVEVRWYDANQTYISTTTIYTSITNPTADWAPQFGHALPPSTARFAKVRLVGAENTTSVAGSSYWDDVRVGMLEFRYKLELTRSTAIAATERPSQWTVPTGVALAVVEMIGGGGGGGGRDSSIGGGGGGGGGYVRKLLDVTAGTAYTVTLGVGGAGGAETVNGSDGEDTVFDTMTASGGTGGTKGGAGGAGGGGSGGDENQTGTTGTAGDTSNGGAGGYALPIGIAGLGGLQASPVVGGDGYYGGGGGGGGDNSGGDGGNGGDGFVIIRY